MEAIAGGEEHQIVSLPAARPEHYIVAVQTLDVGANVEVSMAQVIQNQGVDDGVGLVKGVVRRGEAELHGIAGEPLQQNPSSFCLITLGSRIRPPTASAGLPNTYLGTK